MVKQIYAILPPQGVDLHVSLTCPLCGAEELLPVIYLTPKLSIVGGAKTLMLDISDVRRMSHVCVTTPSEGDSTPPAEPPGNHPNGPSGQ